MKILFLSAANSIHTVRWVNALAERGYEVVLVSKVDHYEEAENSISKKVKKIYLPIKGMKGYYLNAITLRKIYKDNVFDVINVHYASGYGTLARVARIPHVLLSVWGSDVYDFPYESIVKEYILRKNLEYADTIASTSRCMAEQTGKFLKNRRDIKITPFGVDIKKFALQPKNAEREEIVFGLVKSLRKHYGISMIIEAFALFWNILPVELRRTVYLEIYGKGEQLEELKGLTEKKGIEEQVFFKGYIPNNKVPDALYHMNIFLLGSEHESFGVSAIEAMACGLPVIATRVSGFEEVVTNDETGFLVPVNDAKAMAEKMELLYRDRLLREQMGRKGRKKVEELYVWEKNVDAMLEIYKDMAKRKP